MERLSDTTLIFIGGIVVLFAGTFTKQWFTKFINTKFDAVTAVQERNEREREYDNYITMRGQQVTCDCLHHLSMSVLKGDHFEELEAANKELDEYRVMLNKTITEKASRYNVRIDR